VRVGALEENGVGAKAIEIRSIDSAVTVRGEMIGAKCVDGDEDDRGSTGRLQRAAVARREKENEEED
jgi:hypothetical protein